VRGDPDEAGPANSYRAATAMTKLQVYVEAGTRRVFAGAVAWPGWCRSGRTEEAAVRSLIDYADRYVTAIGEAGGAFTPPSSVDDVRVVDRLPGNATTDYGAPDRSPGTDDAPIGGSELERWISLQQAAWGAFDATAAGAAGVSLRKGPRGGGREVDAIVRHVFEADGEYASQVRAVFRAEPGAPISSEMSRLRSAFLEAIRARARGDPLPPSRKTSKVWSPRFAIRRSAWHALDHAWEIEDRSAR
jgi:hypothetical protein